MKKVFYILGILSMALLASCQKDPVENTACVEMAGQWYVTIDAANGGEVVYEDVYGLGNVLMFTSNTAANIATEMLLTDNRDDPFWKFKVKVTADPGAMTFTAQNADNLYVAECYANKGPTMKRIRPRAQGRAYRIEKRMSHITVVLDER